jgi:hypothetical protein
MAIPADKTPLQYYNDQINKLVDIRERFSVYNDDWATIPAGVRAGVKLRVDTAIQAVKLALDDINAVIQAM